MDSYDIRVLFLIFMFYSFMGWIYEIMCSIIQNKKIINRGFFIGPWVPIYGVGALLMTILLRRFSSNIIILFIMCVFLFSILEYLTSFIMEKMFKARWWDYSHRKFNINGRICLEGMIVFGIAGVFGMYKIDPFLIDVITSTSETIITIICIILSILFLLDVVVSFIIISSIKTTANNLRKDNTEEITEKVKEILLGKKYPKRRYVSAFPRLNIK